MPYKDPQSLQAKQSAARRNKVYYEKNRTDIIAYKKIWAKEYYHNNRDKWLNGYNAKSSMTRRMREYGITESEYTSMLEIQNGCCKICDKHFSKLGRTLCVDHCHRTGKIRGLLCDKCNRALGAFEDSVPNLKKAIRYLTS